MGAIERAPRDRDGLMTKMSGSLLPRYNEIPHPQNSNRDTIGADKTSLQE